MGFKLRVAVIVFLAWFALLFVTSVVNGRAFFPAKMDPGAYLMLQTVIAALLGLCGYAVAAIIGAFGDIRK